jgi:hypothetical protein
VEGSTAMAAGSGLRGRESSSACGEDGSGSGDEKMIEEIKSIQQIEVIKRIGVIEEIGEIEEIEEIEEIGEIEEIESPTPDSPQKYVSCLSRQPMDHRLDSVCFRNDSPFGRQFEIFHIAGHVTVRSTPGLPRSVIFKGVKGVHGLQELCKDLFLQPSVLPLVHMGVMSSCLGVRLQTSQCCYLENKVISGIGSMNGGWMRIEPRSMDQCNIVRLSVCKWHSLLPEHLVPTSNDIVITSKGSVMHRMCWPGVEWTAQNEQLVLDVCTWVADQIAASC